MQIGRLVRPAAIVGSPYNHRPWWRCGTPEASCLRKRYTRRHREALSSTDRNELRQEEHIQGRIECAAGQSAVNRQGPGILGQVRRVQRDKNVVEASIEDHGLSTLE